MQKISLKQATAGMKLAKPVENDRGMTLCGAGTELTGDTIDRLIRMEVKKITVEGHPVDTGQEEKSLDQLLKELDGRFKKVAGDPLMKKIKRMISKVLTEQAEEG
jgi:inorganic pyrophosphatase/exopolyphosphatase